MRDEVGTCGYLPKQENLKKGPDRLLDNERHGSGVLKHHYTRASSSSNYVDGVSLLRLAEEAAVSAAARETGDQGEAEKRACAS